MQPNHGALGTAADGAAQMGERGGAGAAGKVELADGTRLNGKGRQRVASGSRLRLRLPGGGGYGDPGNRDRDRVRADLAAGYITPEQAKNQYGFED